MSRPDIQPLYTSLPGGRRAEITIAIIEEPMPTPLEIPLIRPASAHELHLISRQLEKRAYNFTIDPE